MKFIEFWIAGLAMSAGIVVPAQSRHLGMEGKPGPAHDVVLSWATFTDAADESGMSRQYGGVHFEDADTEGRLLGRRAAALSWKKAQGYMTGSGITKRESTSARKETAVSGW